jgi:hypothetical protein
MTTAQFWIYMSTIVLSALIAVQVSERLRIRSDKRSRQMWIFTTLMATRGTRLSQRHVDALNSISVEFHGKAAIIDAWDKYLDMFVNANPGATEPEIKVWLEKGDELLAALLYQIAKDLKYKFSETDLKRKFYVPRAHGDAEAELNIIRRGFFEVFNGQRKIPMEVDFAQEFKDFMVVQQPKPAGTTTPQGAAAPAQLPPKNS